MKTLCFICGSMLILAMLELPIGYYTFLRIIIFIGAIFVMIDDFKIQNEITFSVLFFGTIAILFNPITPIYFNNKDIWMVIDIIVAISFIFKGFTIDSLKLK